MDISGGDRRATARLRGLIGQVVEATGSKRNRQSKQQVELTTAAPRRRNHRNLNAESKLGFPITKGCNYPRHRGNPNEFDMPIRQGSRLGEGLRKAYLWLTCVNHLNKLTHLPTGRIHISTDRDGITAAQLNA